MAFTVRFYQFSKPENSTAVPPAGAASVEFAACQAKTPLSVLSPEISIMFNSHNNGGAEWNPSAYNYCYIAVFNRYYFVRNWTNSGPVWNAELRVDTLATYRTAIGAFTTYVYRSSHEYDGKIKDDQYPFKADVDVTEVSGIPSPFAEYNINVGNWVLVTIMGEASAQHYVMDYSSFVLLILALFDDAYYEDVLGEFGATEYPEAKVAINPLQYIVSAKYVPGSLSDFTNTPNNPFTSVAVGPALVTPGGNFAAYNAVARSSAPTQYTITRPSHPQSASRGSWLNSDPAASHYELYMAPFGFVEIPSQEAGLHDLIVLETIVDAWSGCASLRVNAKDTNDSTLYPIKEITTDFGIELLYSGMLNMTPGMFTLSADIASYTGNSLFGGVLGGFASALSGSGSGVSSVGNATKQARDFAGKMVSYLVPHTATGGSSGGTLLTSFYNSHFQARFSVLVDENNGDMGRPLMANRTLSNIPGFIMCNSENFSISGCTEELETIMRFMESGFHYV